MVSIGAEDIVNAIHDLTRVIIVTSDQFESRSDAMRQLSAMSIPPSRVAALLDVKTKDVTSVVAKAKKRNARQR